MAAKLHLYLQCCLRHVAKDVSWNLLARAESFVREKSHTGKINHNPDQSSLDESDV